MSPDQRKKNPRHPSAPRPTRQAICSAKRKGRPSPSQGVPRLAWSPNPNQAEYESHSPRAVRLYPQIPVSHKKLSHTPSQECAPISNNP